MPKEVKFRLVDTDPNITEDSTFGAAKWCDTWKWRCPQHMSILLKKGDMFSIYAADTADAEFILPDGTNAGALVKIEVRDPSEQKIQLVYGPSNYASCKEFQQISKIAKLNIDQPILVRPREWIVFMTKDHLGTDASGIVLSYCRLLTTKIVE